MKTIIKMKMTPEIEDDPKNEDSLKNEYNIKSEDDLKNENDRRQIFLQSRAVVFSALLYFFREVLFGSLKLNSIFLNLH